MQSIQAQKGLHDMEYSKNSEFLTQEEVQVLTGAKQLTCQIVWLKEHNWVFEINRSNSVIIGRHYARLKLSGISQSDLQLSASNQPNFESVS